RHRTLAKPTAATGSTEAVRRPVVEVLLGVRLVADLVEPGILRRSGRTHTTPPTGRLVVVLPVVVILCLGEHAHHVLERIGLALAVLGTIVRLDGSQNTVAYVLRCSELGVVVACRLRQGDDGQSSVVPVIDEDLLSTLLW